MASKSCSCDPKKVNPSNHFYAKGRADVFMVISLGAYLTEDTRANLDRVRGGRGFAEAIKNLEPARFFAWDRDEEKILESGHDFQIFRRHLIKDWFSPTFYFQKEQIETPDDPQLKSALEKYEVRVRLSRSGFLEIRLTRRTKKDGERIIEIMRDLMELRLSSKSATEDHSTMLLLALFCADRFIENLPRDLTVNEANEQVLLTFQALGPNPAALPYRQRYVTLFLEEIFCTHCGKRRIEADKLRRDYMGILAAIVEGFLVLGDKDNITFPDIGEESFSKIRDLANWRNDLCVFAPERSLIYFPDQKIFISGRDGTRVVDYKYYYECISRGIEHTIVLGAALQQIAYSTTTILKTVPRLTEKVVDGDISGEDLKDIMHIVSSFSQSYRMLPFLRDILLPSTTFRASNAVVTFEYLNAVLNLKEVLDYLERNVDEIVSFVQFYSSILLQDEINKESSSTTNKAGVLITIIVIIVAMPSFLADYHQFAIKNYGFPIWTEWILLTILGVFLVYLMGMRFIQRR